MSDSQILEPEFVSEPDPVLEEAGNANAGAILVHLIVFGHATAYQDDLPLNWRPG